jgi:hypothetical protein
MPRRFILLNLLLLLAVSILQKVTPYFIGLPVDAADKVWRFGRCMRLLSGFVGCYPAGGVDECVELWGDVGVVAVAHNS